MGWNVPYPEMTPAQEREWYGEEEECPDDDLAELEYDMEEYDDEPLPD